MGSSYDPASQVTAILHQLTAISQQINKAEYGYNAVGNRTSLTDRRGSQAFGYYQLNRLTRASHPLGTARLDALPVDTTSHRLSLKRRDTNTASLSVRTNCGRP